MLRDRLFADLGLESNLAFCRDCLFYLALLAGPGMLAVMAWLLPPWQRGTDISLSMALNMVLWQPLVEELFFRGVVQGRLRTLVLGRQEIAGFSMANIITSLFFMTAHLAHDASAWSVAVVVPSLVFGYFRDRHRELFSPLILHSFYNAGYLLAGELARSD